MTNRLLWLAGGLNVLLFILSLIFNDFLFWLFIAALVLNLGVIYRLYSQMRQAQIKQSQQAEALSRSQERNFQLKSSQLETIVNNLPFPIALIDLRGNIVLHNQVFLNFNSSDKAPATYEHEGFMPEVRSFLRQAYLKENNLVKILRLPNSDYQAISVPIYDNKRFNGSLLMFLDVTQILEGEKMQKRFIADASHELKTPLSSILGMVQILNRPGFADRDTQTEFMQQIENETRRMDNIIQDLLVLSKISAQKILLNTVPVSLRQLISESQAPLKQQFLEHNNRFELSVDAQLTWMLDRDKFHQVFTNLLTNALKFTQDGIISVSAELIESMCVIKVSDTGSGIREEDQRYIFERFFRSDPSRSRGSGGSGLGLAIVKSYVQAHRGEIEVSSELGKGTTFTIRLPRS